MMSFAGGRHFYYAGSILLISALLGGGTDQGLWSDHLIQILLLPAIFMGVGAIGSTRLAFSAKALAVGIILLCLLQFIPVYRQLAIPAALGEPTVWSLWSPHPGRSLEASLFVISATAFALYVSRFSDEDQFRLFRVFAAGMAINMVAAAIQLSFQSRAVVTGILPFELTAGMFANENHLSTLVYMALPLFAYRYLIRSNSPLVFCAVAFLLTFFLFGVGSRAAIVIGPILAILAYIWFTAGNRYPAVVAFAGMLAAAVFLYALWALGERQLLEQDLRETFFRNTISAIRDNWLLGTGMGTFVLAYPQYEPIGDIVRVYANHAHNDYLEIIMENGIFGVILIALYLLSLLSGVGRTKLSQAAFMSIFAVLLHSLVDYPLRTFAIALPFAWLSAVVLSVKPFGEAVPETTKELVSVASRRRRRDTARPSLDGTIPE
jgi:O-antigen ligase